MKFIMMAMIATLAFAPVSYADDTVGDKTESTMDSATDKMKSAGRKTKRMAKKGAHRVEEAVCMEGDLECAAKKAGNRVEEGKDTTVDKVKDKTGY
ncbi:hypothetical protein [Bdellovibrio reynosensis]|uniref:CsbD family protein n=1 Tax=Bdellovibrio reynosensis TaxID=2835041 RepID=A0ABY4CEJ5_9BACT|nr:hypothetical protein [Bdellovibrio reynosensis]UOF02312.1 hypothetical protein MNR06_05025 [Bdellovibrio reynosensis]